MFSILKATIARLIRAEASIDKIIKALPELDPGLAIRLNESRIDNINVFNYAHNLHSRILLKEIEFMQKARKQMVLCILFTKELLQ